MISFENSSYSIIKKQHSCRRQIERRLRVGVDYDRRFLMFYLCPMTKGGTANPNPMNYSTGKKGKN